MRKPVELIEELQAMGREFHKKSLRESDACIVVAFERTPGAVDTDTASALDLAPLNKLNYFLRNGGNPIGLCGYLTLEVGGRPTVDFYQAVYKEHEHRPEAHEIMGQQLIKFKKVMAEQGFPMEGEQLN